MTEGRRDDVWGGLRRATTYPTREIPQGAIPSAPGVYVWHRDGKPIYVGKARDLRSRIARHRRTDFDLSRSAFRRNVAEHIGVASVAECRQRPSILTSEQVERINAWVAGCTVSWSTTSSPDEASALERSALAANKPPLNRAG